MQTGPEGRADAAKTGTPQLLPAKSGKLESKDCISSMLQDDSAMQPVDTKGKGSKTGCFGSGSKGKDSNKPCVIF